MGRLNGTRVYLIGPIDRAKDGGVGWRNKIKPFLKSLGVTILDPCDKPCASFYEDEHFRKKVNEFKKQGDLEKSAEMIRPIRSIDLRMVDISDFTISHIDISIHLAGSYEEIFTANRQKKPVLTFVYPNKYQTPNWILGTLPTEHIFSNLEEIKNYLEAINDETFSLEEIDKTERWKFFELFGDKNK